MPACPRRRACRRVHSSFTAKWEIPANFFWQVTRFRHVNFWNAPSFDKNVVALFCITLRSYQFIIKPRCDWACSRQWNCDRNLCNPVVGRRCSVRKLDRERADGRGCPYVRIDGRIFYRRSDLVAFIAAHVRGGDFGDAGATADPASRRRPRGSTTLVAS
jgi:hypothetical protein